MMTRQKRIFLILAVIFFAAMAYIAYDISSRTTFPGSKSQLKERIKEQYGSDSTEQKVDSTGIETVNRSN